MKILVSVPNTGWIHKHVAFALLRIQQDRRFSARIILPTHNPLENNQHHIVRDFLAGGEDFWLSFDADNPPIQNPLDAVEFNKDILGFPTPVWHYENGQEANGERPVYWNAYKRKGDEGYNEWPAKKGLQKVDAVGMGCFLIARRVFEHPEMQKGAFTRKLLSDGRVDRGNDISFCERAAAAGFEIWADYDRPCRHFVELELTEVIRATL